MAFLTKSASMFLFMALSFLLVMQLLQSSDCNVGDGCFYVKAALQEMKPRKMLYGLEAEKQMVLKTGVAGPAAGGKLGKKLEDGWQLRQAPLGPDPMHHHAGGPKKPWTSP